MAALASLCFTPHPQLIPFMEPKFCLSSWITSLCFQHIKFDWGPWAAMLCLPLVSLRCSEELLGYRLIEVFWPSGNSVHHEHSKTSFCLQSNTVHIPTGHTVPGHWFLRNILSIPEQKKNSHFECQKRPILFILGLKCSLSAMRPELTCFNI